MPERYLGQLLGKYRVEELIGSGGFAWVYRAFDPELEIPVALKVLKPQFAGDINFEQRFRREASTAAKLRHPNIIKIFSVGREGEAVYFAMDFLPSGLADKLEATPFLPEEFIVRIGMDVARALGFAHREGVIHRDIKVDNILFDGHGNAVVADFGIARAVSGYTQQTGTNMVVGTPQYFAPEQARAKPLDGRADLYSLGVTLYRASTGRLPFEGDDWYEIARQHVEEEPPRPRTINPNISSELESVMLRCLAKHPDDRPATGEQLHDELDAMRHRTRELGAMRNSGTHGEATLITPGDPRLESAGGAPRKGRRGAFAAVAGAILVVALAGASVPLLARLRGASGAPRVPMDTVAPSTPAGDSVVVAIPDTTVRDTITKPVDLPPARLRDTVVTPVPNTAKLRLTVPDNATVTVNGKAVPAGWRADTLKPGVYELVASIPAPAGCESAIDRKSQRLERGQTRTVVLQPKGCGLIKINGQLQGVQYEVASTDAVGFARNGTLSAAGIVVPAGRFRLILTKSLCSPYQEYIDVAASQTVVSTVRWMC